MKHDAITEQKLTPPEALQPIFTHFYEASNTTAESFQKRLFPSLQTKLVFNLGAPTPLWLETDQMNLIEKYIIIGPSKQILRYELAPGSRLLVANLRMMAFTDCLA